MAKTFISSTTFTTNPYVSQADFTSGLDSTYDEYQFYLDGLAMRGGWGYGDLQFQVNASGNTGFAETIQSSYWRARQEGTDGNYGSNLIYDPDFDQANGTAYQTLCPNIGQGSNQSGGGILTLYAPTDTSHVKLFHFRGFFPSEPDWYMHTWVSGYINTTSAIDEISFRVDNSWFDRGTISMYGVS